MGQNVPSWLMLRKDQQPGRNPGFYLFFLSSEWLFVWVSSCSVVRQKATSYLLLCHSYNSSFFFHSLKMIFFFQTVYVKYRGNNMFIFHPFVWRNLAEDCWVLGRLANGSNPCSRFILFGCLKREIKKPRWHLSWVLSLWCDKAAHVEVLRML